MLPKTLETHPGELFKAGLMGDPNALTNVDWAYISTWLTMYWIAFPLVIFTAFTLMIAHGFIPSAVQTGHLPYGFRRLVWPLTLLAVIVWVVAWFFWASVIQMSPGMLSNIYERLIV